MESIKLYLGLTNAFDCCSSPCHPRVIFGICLIRLEFPEHSVKVLLVKDSLIDPVNSATNEAKSVLSNLM